MGIDTTILESQTFRDMVRHGNRHWCIRLIISTQMVGGLKPWLWKNADRIIIQDPGLAWNPRCVEEPFPKIQKLLGSRLIQLPYVDNNVTLFSTREPQEVQRTRLQGRL